MLTAQCTGSQWQSTIRLSGVGDALDVGQRTFNLAPSAREGRLQAGAIEKGRRKGLALGSDVKSSSDPDSLCAVVLRVTKDGGRSAAVRVAAPGGTLCLVVLRAMKAGGAVQTRAAALGGSESSLAVAHRPQGLGRFML